MEGINYRAEARRQLIIREKHKADMFSMRLSGAGMTRQLMVSRTERADPKRGGCEGYDPNYRIAVLEYARN